LTFVAIFVQLSLTPIVYKLRCAGLVRARGDQALRISNNELTGRRLKDRLNRWAFLQSKPALAVARDADVPIPLFLEIIFTIFA
jgi:hypothetical protein